MNFHLSMWFLYKFWCRDEINQQQVVLLPDFGSERQLLRMYQPFQKKTSHLPALKLTYPLKINGWNTIISFWGPAYFPGANYSFLGSVYVYINMYSRYQSCMRFFKQNWRSHKFINSHPVGGDFFVARFPKTSAMALDLGGRLFVGPRSSGGSVRIEVGVRKCRETPQEGSTLLETNISPKKGTFEDDFPFPKVGYVSSLEGKCWKSLYIYMCVCFCRLSFILKGSPYWFSLVDVWFFTEVVEQLFGAAFRHVLM